MKSWPQQLEPGETWGGFVNFREVSQKREPHDMTARTLKLDDCPFEDSRKIKGWEHENSIMIWGVWIRLSVAPVIRGTPRSYFDCPACNRRCCKVFLVRGEVRCQKCSGLLYASQSRSWSEHNARRIGCLTRMLGKSDPFDVCDVRPRYMRERTHFYLQNKLKVAWADRAQSVAERLFPLKTGDLNTADEWNNSSPWNP